MLIVEPVLEAVGEVGAAPWPVSVLPPYTFLVLTGRLSESDVGAAMALLTDWFATDPDESGCVPDAAERVRRLIAADQVAAAGGLRVRDAVTGVTVTPGCCCGLEDWRQWLRLPDGVHVYLGHDPTPRVEFDGRVVHVWPDGGDDEERPAGQPIRLPLSELPGMLHSVRAELAGFLDLVARWADRHVPAQAAELVAKLDADLEIGAPLTTP
ncbi:hypothetical protein [Streptomyces sp. BE230]|uniref:hypothetical protein n=1 Tax=Streptomyces sp. BE230 TaxID=3002526 RepID=UPI002ED102F4|nr:hypothetical protein [Streptomyces sp. BE230]